MRILFSSPLSLCSSFSFSQYMGLFSLEELLLLWCTYGYVGTYMIITWSVRVTVKTAILSVNVASHSYYGLSSEGRQYV